MEISKNPFKILSIDGGGLRGVAVANVLSHIESITGKPIFDSFDLFAGTSTGGLIASALTVRNPSTNRPKYTVNDIDNLYRNHGKIIFPCTTNKVKKMYHGVRSVIRPRFSRKGLDKTLEQFLQSYRLTDCLKPVFISTFDLQRYKPIVFTSRSINRTSKGHNSNANINALLVDICKATSAAPVYLSPHQFLYADDSQITYQANCIDGGVYSNNPALSAYLEVITHLEDPIYNKGIELTESDICILSIGTGKTQKAFHPVSTVSKWGKLRWVLPVINVMMDGNSQAVDLQLRALLNFRYFRIDPDIETKHSDMADSSTTTFGHLTDKVNFLFRNEHFVREFKNFARFAQL